MVISNRKKIRLKGNMTTAFKYMKFYVAEVISVLLQKAEWTEDIKGIKCWLKCWLNKIK